MLHHVDAEQDVVERDDYFEEEVLEGDFTFRAVMVGLLVGYVLLAWGDPIHAE
jgi:hypothetical protein